MVKYAYNANVSGEVEIDDTEIAELPADKRDDFIQSQIMEEAYQTLDSEINWEKVDEDDC